MKRFFVNKCTGEDFTLTGTEHNHLASVLRCSVGEEIVVICGDNYNYIYRIKQIQRTGTALEFVKRTKNVCNPAKRLTVFMALIKSDNVALAVQKLTELGATELVLFNSARCNVSPVLVNVARLNTIAQQSCKQCGRSIPITVKGILSFEQLLNQIEDRKAFFADESSSALPRLHSVAGAQNDETLIIGPEGGFTKLERDRLCKKTIPVSLGKRILRAETAVIAGASIILSHMGEI